MQTARLLRINAPVRLSSSWKKGGRRFFVRVIVTHQLSAEASGKVILLLHPQDEDLLSEQLASLCHL